MIFLDHGDQPCRVILQKINKEIKGVSRLILSDPTSLQARLGSKCQIFMTFLF